MFSAASRPALSSDSANHQVSALRSDTTRVPSFAIRAACRQLPGRCGTPSDASTRCEGICAAQVWRPYSRTVRVSKLAGRLLNPETARPCRALQQRKPEISSAIPIPNTQLRPFRSRRPNFVNASSRSPCILRCFSLARCLPDWQATCSRYIWPG